MAAERPGAVSRYKVPFSKPSLTGDELPLLEEAVRLGHLSGDGEFTRRCSELLEAELETHRVLLTPSCTQALEMCALLLDLGPGDEFVVPSFAFVSTANAFVLRGATPVFVDVRRDTLNLDESQVRERLTGRTRAIVALHYGGVGCEMDELRRLAAEASVALIEDNAHGLFGRYRDAPLGTLGDLGTLSFHGSKNFTCGEGGALVINDERWIGRAEILREKGTERTRFLRGELDRYTWVDLGSSYLPSELQAAFLYAQLRKREQLLAERLRLWTRYRQALAGWGRRQGVEMARVPPHCRQTHHIFWLLLPDAGSRSRFVADLKERGIPAPFHYLPLHLSRMGRRWGAASGDCPVTESVSERLVRLPLYNGLSRSLQDEVIDAVLETRTA